jgi:hypothetical protein
MPFVTDPRGRSWGQITEDLRDLRAAVDLFKKRFQAAGRNEVAENLEECILMLLGAEAAAKALDLEGR